MPLGRRKELTYEFSTSVNMGQSSMDSFESHEHVGMSIIWILSITYLCTRHNQCRSLIKDVILLLDILYVLRCRYIDEIAVGL